MAVTFNMDSEQLQKRQKGTSLIDFPSKFTVIDIETTGLDTRYCEIIEISAIKYDGGKQIDKYSTLVKPNSYSFANANDTDFCVVDGEKVKYVDEFITNLTGITNKMLENAPEISTAIVDFKNFISNSILIGHNVNFDINFLYDALAKNTGKHLDNDYVDTLRLSKRLLPELPHHRLQDLTAHFKIEYIDAHRAEHDCIFTYKVFKQLETLCLAQYGSIDNFADTCKHRKNWSAKDITAQGDNFDIDSPFYQKEVVFTGALKEMVRREAMQLVVNVGGTVADGVRKTTNFLVLGTTDFIKSIKGGKTAKYIKAEKMQLQGKDISIISESTFLEYIRESNLELLPPASQPDSFACCSRYVQCSDAKKCVHPDISRARQCQYKKNLDNGRIFYGKNKTTK